VVAAAQVLHLHIQVLPLLMLVAAAAALAVRAVRAAAGLRLRQQATALLDQQTPVAAAGLVQPPLAQVRDLVAMVVLVLRLFAIPTHMLTLHPQRGHLRLPRRADTKSTSLPVAGASPSNGFHHRRSCP